MVDISTSYTKIAKKSIAISKTLCNICIGRIFIGKVDAKMKKIISAALILATLTLSVFASPVSFAAKCPDDAGTTEKGQKIYCCGAAQTSIDFNCAKSDKPGANTVTSLLLTIINFLAIGVGIAVVGGIVFGALRYSSANGNASHAQQGITFIVNAVIGLILFIFMYAIINFLVPGGLFT